MAGKKHFVARKVGDHYELQSANLPRGLAQCGWVAGGALLALQGISRRSIPGLIVAVVGGGLIYRGITGRNPLAGLCPGCQTEDTGPSYARDDEHPAQQQPEDGVDEASMESFPASDAPSYTRSRT